MDAWTVQEYSNEHGDNLKTFGAITLPKLTGTSL